MPQMFNTALLTHVVLCLSLLHLPRVHPFIVEFRPPPVSIHNHFLSLRSHRSNPSLSAASLLRRMSGGGPEDGTKRQELRALLLDFASENMEYTAEELRKSGGEKVAESLASSLEALKGGGDSAPAAQIVVDLCWEKLSNGGGWPTVGWREAYVFSLMAVALAPIETGDKSAEALESARKSMKDLDMALIMGGPGASDIVLAFVDCIEPLILSANKDGDKDEDSSSYIVSADVPPHAPSINEAFAVERVASISFAGPPRRLSASVLCDDVRH